MADLIGAVVALLKADTATAAQVGVRVFGGELPPAETALMPRKAIVLTPSGGTSLTSGSFVEADTQRFDLFAYGATPAEAEALRDTAALALRRARRRVWAGVLIHWLKPAGGATNARDANAQWPRAFQSFQALHALNSVS